MERVPRAHNATDIQEGLEKVSFSNDHMWSSVMGQLLRVVVAYINPIVGIRQLCILLSRKLYREKGNIATQIRSTLSRQTLLHLYAAFSKLGRQSTWQIAAMLVAKSWL